ITNHRLSGTRATALTRCDQKCPVPDFALPKPRAAASGVRILITFSQVRYWLRLEGQSHYPDDDGQCDGNADSRIAGALGCFQFETNDEVPRQMTNTVTQMVKQRPRPAEQQNQPVPGTVNAVCGGKGLRAGRSGTQPDGEQHAAHGQTDPAETVQSRCQHRYLPAVNLQVRRKRSIGIAIHDITSGLKTNIKNLYNALSAPNRRSAWARG